MNDTELLDWLDEHGTGIFTHDRGNKIELVWVDTDGEEKSTFGSDLRDCIRGAVLGETGEVKDIPGFEGVREDLKALGA